MGGDSWVTFRRTRKFSDSFKLATYFVFRIGDDAVNSGNRHVNNLAGEVQLLTQPLTDCVGLRTGVQHSASNVLLTVDVDDNQYNGRKENVGVGGLHRGYNLRSRCCYHCRGNTRGAGRRYILTGRCIAFGGSIERSGVDHGMMPLRTMLAIEFGTTVAGKMVATEAVAAELLIRDHP